MFGFFHQAWGQERTTRVFVARKLDGKGWTKHLSISVIWWLALGSFIKGVYRSQSSLSSDLQHSTNGVGQILMTAGLSEQQWDISGSAQCALSNLSLSGEKAPAILREIPNLSHQ